MGILAMALLTIALDPVPMSTIRPDDFQDWFLKADEGTLAIPEEVEARAAGFRYVFVGGLQHERMPGYFSQNIRALVDSGVPGGAIHRIDPSSHKTYVDNLESLRKEFLAVAEEGPEPLVIIAHSRGACDALAFALSEPEFVDAHVEALFLVQGPFGGSGLADYAFGDGEPMDDQMAIHTRALAHLLGKLEKGLLHRGRHGGLADLTREASDGFWARTLEEYADVIPIVGPRTFYIESHVDPRRQPLLRRPMAKYLDTYYGPNDGLVAEGDQFLPGLGTRLGTLDVGHADLTHRFPAGRRGRRHRSALIQAILMAVGRSESEEPESSDAPEG